MLRRRGLARLWWSASNWRNRFVVPITFGPPPNVCDILDSRAPTGFYGSELLAQAALQWSPAYCLNKKRFKFQLNQMPDAAGWHLMASGGGSAALVSSEHHGAAPTRSATRRRPSPASRIGYVVDKPDNTGEYTQLRLNARLLAKLMTLSYAGSDLRRAAPGHGGQPAGASWPTPSSRSSTPASDRAATRRAPRCCRSRTRPTSSSS